MDMSIMTAAHRLIRQIGNQIDHMNQHRCLLDLTLETEGYLIDAVGESRATQIVSRATSIAISRNANKKANRGLRK